jgi:phosphoserine phosphatase
MVDAMNRYGYIQPEDLERIEAAKLAWRERLDSYNNYLYTVVDIFEQCFGGMLVEVFNKIAEEVVARYRDEVYRFTRQLVLQCQDQDWYIHAISASPEIAVQAFCQQWHIKGFSGTYYEVVDQRYLTGNRHILEHDLKAEIITELLKRPEFAHLSKDQIWACGDTIGDLAMLEHPQVGRAICNNPSDELRELAENNGWLWVMERKNVICEHQDGQYLAYNLDDPRSKRKVPVLWYS